MPPALQEILERTFGFTSFRPHQEAVCRAVVDGRDALLVMPTGSGKSLCYQLPALARPGAALVISPLIALMEDQVAKLARLGLRAERIHSGRDRESSRQVCRDYLAGAIDLLFVAPERLAVRGFPELLGRGRLALVAVDEAHCISHWGHDFRPDYRMIRERLPRREGVPVIALTATATPLVQDDIVRQLGLEQAQRHIHGFRRDNIAVEVVELPPSRRAAAVEKVLSDAGRRPAIVYAPSRKETEQLAGRLAAAGLRAGAYHAGLGGARRDQVQAAFLGGDLEVIVATIAFGMGVDKPDVRSVIHTAMPGTVEGYYQEIGRAGRDGRPSRAILLCSYADRRTHEYFLERDYPEPELLARVHDRLGPAPQPKAGLREALGFEPDDETFDTALAKLWLHGGALVTPEETVRRGPERWRRAYTEQREHRRRQLELMGRYVELPACRMLRLVQHFGDQEDSGAPCGLCDVCDPDASLVQRRREAGAEELRRLERILVAVAAQERQATGRLYREELSGDMDRREFERLLAELARAGMVRLQEDAFEKEGRTISFRRVSLSGRGARVVGGQSSLAGIVLEEREEAPPTRRKGRSARRAVIPPPSPAVAEALREWRLATARRRDLPAFCVMSDRTLQAIAGLRPRTEEELLQVPGVGAKFLASYGEAVLGIVEERG